MNRVLHSLLVWLMAIAMPVQGIAASMMLACGPAHERMVQGVSHVVVAAGHDHAGEHSHDDHGAGSPVHAHDEPNPGATAGADANGAEAPAVHHGKFSCSACAACCIMLAPPASFSLPPDPGPVNRVQTTASAPTPSHSSDPLDRPPRARHA
jgi:hypothetical protein